MIKLFLLIFIAGIAKAVMDTLLFHYDKSIFKSYDRWFWNSEISWLNKYEPKADGDTKYIRKKWFGFIPVPVMLTDGWHLFQAIFLTSVFVAIVCYTPIFKAVESNHLRMLIDFIFLRGLFGLVFIMFYDWVLIKK